MFKIYMIQSERAGGGGVPLNLYFADETLARKKAEQEGSEVYPIEVIEATDLGPFTT